MSTASGIDRSRPSRGGRLAIAGLLALIVLAVIWPAPVVWLNDATFRLDIRIDHESFLMREAPEWDVAFWWIAGTFVIVVAGRDTNGWTRGLKELRRSFGNARTGLRLRGERAGRDRVKLVALMALVAVALSVAVLDRLAVDRLLSVDQASVFTLTSLVNRFGGGVTPVIVVLFIGVVGVARGREVWVQLFAAIVFASIVSAAVLHLLKLTGRVRPELFRSVLELDPGAGASFPSGHTLSAFVVAGAIALVSQSRVVRVTLLGAATLIALNRVLTFRHWPSDVVFSAILGLATAWFFVNRLVEHETSEPSVSYREETT